MKNNPLQIKTISDLFRFHRDVRRNHIYGTVRQNYFSANARNTLMLALALPLEDACLEIAERKSFISNGEVCAAVK